MPAARLSCVTASSRSVPGAISPTPMVVAESACNPSKWTPTSTLTMLPSRSTRFFEGIPCTISWLMEVQRVLGKP